MREGREKFGRDRGRQRDKQMCGNCVKTAHNAKNYQKDLEDAVSAYHE